MEVTLRASWNGIGLAVAVSFWVGSAALGDIEPVAMVTDIAGRATLIREGKSSPLALLSYLEPGTEIRIQPEARVTLTLFSAPVEHAFVGPATVAVRADGVRAVKGVAPETRTLNRDRAAALRGSGLTPSDRLTVAATHMRSLGAPRLRLLGPIDTQVLTLRPEFTWTEIPGADKYRLVITDSRGKVAHSLLADGGVWQPPTDTTLSCGEAYRWRIEARLASGETAAAEGEFRLVDAARAKRILTAQPSLGAPFSDYLLYALLLENEGLAFDAAYAWKALAQERPDDPVLQERSAR